jgi:formate hydrogenlyase subunit 4
MFLVVLLIPGGLVAAGISRLLKTDLFSTHVTVMVGAIVWFSIRTNVAHLRWDKRRPFWWPWR